MNATTAIRSERARGQVASVEERFWQRVDKSGLVPAHVPELGPCWLWTGSKLPKGYGRFYPKWKGAVYAHRFSWELRHGRTIPAGMEVLHRCDNPACVNPDHLTVGTHLDNVADMDQKGRRVARALTGEQHPNRKLSIEQVRTIRARWAAGGVRQRVLAAEFGVTRGLIGQIVRGKAWRSA